MAFMIPVYERGEFAEGEDHSGEGQLVPWEHRDVVEWHGRPRKVKGWFTRLSAPGYMDATEWAGPFKSQRAAADYIEETYEVDPDSGEALSGCICGPRW